MSDDQQLCSNVTWSEKGQPISKHYGDMYFSIADGLAETRYVFLEKNRLAKRFKQLKNGEHFIIGETGFGTGLNFLCTWEYWLQYAPVDTHCHFISTEKYPLTYQELKQSLQLWPSLQTLANDLLEAYQKQFIGTSEQHYYRFDFGCITLTLIADDVCQGLKKLLPGQHKNFNQPQWQGVDTWYLDGFSPAKNPDMWSDELLQLIHLLSKKNASLSTYTAASSVKKTLEANGFSVNKEPGFGKKRELITASLNKKDTIKYTFNGKNQTPWAYNQTLSNTAVKQDKHIAIIGAGLAGCHTAYALANKGFKVTIYEVNEQIANEASGNPQAMLYTKLSANKEPLSEFNLACLLKAQTFYSQFWEQCNNSTEGSQCGLLQLAQNDSTLEKQSNIWERFSQSNFLQKTSPETNTTIANITIDSTGLYLPYCGWVNPQALCHWLLSHENITLQTITNVKTIEMIKSQQWQLTIEQAEGSEQHHFTDVVICNAYAATQFMPTTWLPTKTLRGQISYIESETPISDLKTIVTGENYIAPVLKNKQQRFHTIGASYDLKNTHKQLTDIEHQKNLTQLNKLLPPTTNKPLIINGGRANLRCTSPDYLPLVGCIPKREQFLAEFTTLTKNARQAINKAGEYLPGIYLNTGHGSRGLAYTPMAAEIVACQITQTPPPLPQALIDSLNPARFIIREIKKMPRD